MARKMCICLQIGLGEISFGEVGSIAFALADDDSLLRNGATCHDQISIQ
jgi:hypothetical protein